MESSEDFKKRLLYNSHHRGMREMDLLLGRFAQHHIPLMSAQELEEFDNLLAYSDQELFGWFFEKRPVPETISRSLLIAIQKGLVVTI
jgi:antitoxin CptB